MTKPHGLKNTASLDNLTCTHCVDFGICQDKFGQFFRSKSVSNYLDVQQKLFKKEDNRELSLVQIIIRVTFQTIRKIEE